MKQTKDSLSTQSHNVEFGVSVSEENIGFTIMDKTRMMNAQMSFEEAEIFVHFMARRLRIPYFKSIVKRQGSIIESMENRNEELRRQLWDLSERANIIFSDYEAGNLLCREDMTKLKEESQKAEYLIEKR